MKELKPRIHDEQNGLDYVLVGDYYIPAITFVRIAVINCNLRDFLKS